jgi:hypothetical protein
MLARIRALFTRRLAARTILILLAQFFVFTITFGDRWRRGRPVTGPVRRQASDHRVQPGRRGRTARAGLRPPLARGDLRARFRPRVHLHAVRHERPGGQQLSRAGALAAAEVGPRWNFWVWIVPIIIPAIALAFVRSANPSEDSAA